MKKILTILCLFIQVMGFSQSLTSMLASQDPKPVSTQTVDTKPVKAIAAYITAEVKRRVDEVAPKLEVPKPWSWSLFFFIYKIVFIVLFTYNLVEILVKWKEFRRHRLEEFGFHWYSMIAWAGFVMSWWY